jgi:uncharacterized membrane protein
MSQKIELEVAPLSLKAFRGETVESTIILRNRGQSVDQFTISIEGISPEWYNLPVSSVALFPNDQDKVKIIITLPEKSEIKSNLYIVKIKVTSQENPADVSTADLKLEIGTAPSLVLDFSPAQITGRKGKYQLSLANPGDKDVKVNIKVQSHHGRIRLKASPDGLTVPAGKKAEAVIDASLSWLTLFLKARPYEFQVSAEPVDRVDVAPVGENGQLTGNPWYRIFSKIRLPWLSRAPAIQSFIVTTDNKREFHLKWEVQRAKKVRLDDEDVENLGEIDVRPAEARQYVLTAVNRNGTVSQKRDVNPLPQPKARTSENIKITLSGTHLQMQAGLVPSMITAQVQNLSDIVDKFLVEIEGLDDSWYSRSASSLALMPKTTDQVQISLHPPRKKGVKSGIYPFAVTVRSQSSSQEFASSVGQVEILPGVEIKTKINPFRITAKKKGSYRVSLTNINVSDADVALEATDLDEGCRFQFLQEKVRVGAWKSLEVPMIVRPKRGSIIGEIKRFDITVTANAEGATMPQTANCELTHRPWLKDWKPIWRTIRIIISIVIVIVVLYFLFKMGGGWSVLRDDPKGWMKNFVDTIMGWFPK